MSAHAHAGTKASKNALMFGAIGVVFGDIGTSPLYTLKEAFGEHYGLAANQANILGILSLVFWAMILVVTVKYVMIITRADNRGEGGILSLMSVVNRALPIASPLTYAVGILGILGTAFFFGDAVITPAMSVLSAVEGLELLTPKLHKYIIPVVLVVLAALFSFQRYGTEKVGKVFGPITTVWFFCIAILGLMQIIENPVVLQALNPLHAVNFFMINGKAAWLVLGAVVLCVTGGEALYADMGHFGRMPIRNAWLYIVLPSLVLNYFGQGSLVLADPSAVNNPFYNLVPEMLLIPMIILATFATVIASQAVISGAFSLARQAMQLGYLPRLQLKHTSAHTIGQIYVPWVNYILFITVIGLVLGFQSSSAMAAAYGVSVTGSMLIDTVLMIILASQGWRVKSWIIWVLGVSYLVIDIALFSANAIKFLHGAWVPVLLGIVVFTIMRTWRHGRDLVRAQVNRDSLRIEHFIKSIMVEPPLRVPGTAIFMTPSNDYLPPSMLHNLKHNKVLHAHNILLSVDTLSVPRADDDERYSISDLGNGFTRCTLRFGFMEDPDVPKALATLKKAGLDFDTMDTTYFASREALTAKADQGMVLWRDKLFLFMSRNATPATEFFGIPGERLVELGTKVVI
ncbi:potassium transporter Kup [Arenimonas sp. GDDSR-1]|uniref:potassium transporter Kup n=1 Tax=Arenimonas sp. GDDSR-1 TaxID=2950125 RepID=UPI00261F9E3F|nr:potassium transporter Kup [Arenimonas sp. GDDSR-1]